MIFALAMRDSIVYLGLCMLLILVGNGKQSYAGNPLIVGHFSAIKPASGISLPWEALTFPRIPKHTEYLPVRMAGTVVIQAQSNGGASGLIRVLNIDPNQFPWLQWRWRIDHVLDKGDATTKQGDDFAARIYVTFKFEADGKSWGERFRHRAASIAADRQLPGSTLTYIWANKAFPGNIINSPYTDQAKMVVVRSGNVLAAQWINEQRNIVADYRSAFGKHPPPITGIAIMTDTDNTGESTRAYYGDILLTEGTAK